MLFFVACGGEAKDSDARTSTNVKNSFSFDFHKNLASFPSGHICSSRHTILILRMMRSGVSKVLVLFHSCAESKLDKAKWKKNT